MNKGTKVTLSVLALVIAWLAVLPAPVKATSGTLTITMNTTLTEDHGGNIVIAVDGVTLDCAGFAVSGSTFQGIALIGRTGVTVQNCEVTGFAFGIRLVSSSGNTLTGNTARDNSKEGFLLQVASNGNTLTGNTADDNGRTGFLVQSSIGNTLTGNRASGNLKHGFSVAFSDGNTLTGNTADDNGIFVGDRSTDTPSFSTAFTGGFFLIFADDNVVVDNTANDNTLFGLHIFEGSDNTLTGNAACGNRAVDALQMVIGRTTGNVFVDNDFCSSSGI